MKRHRAPLACVAALALLVALAPPARAGTGTSVTIACSDGSSMTGVVTASALLQLTQDLQTLTSCAFAADPPATPAGSWTVYDYNPSGHAIAPRVSANSLPATTAADGTVSFQFIPGTFTALLITTDSSLTGDLTGRSLSDTITVSGDPTATFQYQNGGGCPDPVAHARFYFTSARSSGPSYPPPGPPVNGLPPRGFYTQFWWSNPVNAPLASGSQPPSSISASLPDPGMWSDWDGQNGLSRPEVTEAFMTAVANVKSVGLSYGGGCFFENGVTTTGNVTFSSKFSESP